MITKTQNKEEQKELETNNFYNKGLPRLSVFRSNKNILAQIIDDKHGRTLAFFSSQKLKNNKINKTDQAKLVGKEIALLALKKKITRVKFDRGPYKYHGRVKALAHSARKGGLIFKMNHRYQNKKDSEFEDKVIQIKRVSKKTKGGNQISFTALMVSGDKKSRVGVGLGKAKNVADAITKRSQKGAKNLITIPIVNDTIPHQIKLKFKAGLVLIKPGKKGSGLIAGGPVKAVLELGGLKDIASKVIGSKNKSINVWTTFKALSKLKS